MLQTNPEVAPYLQELLEHPDNRGPPIVIRVSDRLPVNAVRVVNPATGAVEIIFSTEFIETFLADFVLPRPCAAFARLP